MSKQPPKAAAELLACSDEQTLAAAQQQAAAAAAPAGGKAAPTTDPSCPAWVFWALAALGFVFPPFWWACIALGCTKGSERECLVRRKRGLTTSQQAAWWGCMVLTLMSAAALILVLAISFGRPPAGNPVFYVTMAGPASAMPTIDGAHLTMVATAVHAALGLPTDYPASTIVVWVESAVTSSSAGGPTPTRHLLQASPAPNANATNTTLEFGFVLPRSADAPNVTLPAAADIEGKLASADAVSSLADSLAGDGFVDDDKMGLLTVAMDNRSRAERQRERGQAHAQGSQNGGRDRAGAAGADHASNTSADATGTPLPVSVLGGSHRDCKGEFTEWGACNATCGGGWKARNFTVTSKPKSHGRQCNVTDGATEWEVCNTEPCNGCRAGGSVGDRRCM